MHESAWRVFVGAQIHVCFGVNVDVYATAPGMVHMHVRMCALCGAAGSHWQRLPVLSMSHHLGGC